MGERVSGSEIQLNTLMLACILQIEYPERFLFLPILVLEKILPIVNIFRQI